MNGEKIEGKYYEQELLKSEFDFESNKRILESVVPCGNHSPHTLINSAVNSYTLKCSTFVAFYFLSHSIVPRLIKYRYR